MSAKPPFPLTDAVPIGISALRIALRLLLIGLAIWLVTLLSGWLGDQTSEPDGLSMLGVGILLLVLLAYALLIAVPFVPGIEIGLGLIMIQGASVVPYVYVATVAGLLTAFMVGRLVPDQSLHRLLLDLRLRRACALHQSLISLTPSERLQVLTDRLPRGLKPIASGYRYLALALAINIPGNGLIGGGGGLCMVAGVSRLFDVRWTVLTITLAVAPIPLFVWFTGKTLF